MNFQRERTPLLLTFIVNFQRAHGYAPACVDMARWFGVTDDCVSRWMARLEDAGIIRRAKGVRKGIEVLR